jgi:D-alanyl-D-alanine carboxypeptidase/D-alanyl-D-alanine-endopeptidase (penicillin-binding protein 4)
MNQLARYFLIFIFAMGISFPGAAGDSAKILRRDLDRIFSDERFAGAHWGVEVFSLDRSEMLYERNSRRLYTPASNNKILTAAAALIRLGPDYRFETRVLADGPIENGVLKGNLVIRGSGDPSNSARFQSGNPFSVFIDWAAKLKDRNVRSIAGNILGDAGALDEIQFGQGWEWNDLGQSYAAPVSALQFNDNMIAIEITPGTEKGNLASIRTYPLANYPTIDNRIMTEKEGAPLRIQIGSGGSSEPIVARGSVPSNGPVTVQTVAAQSPVRYYLSALMHTLSEQGINTETCEVKEKRNYTSPSLSLLWIHASPALSEILKPLLKASQNLYAETLTRALGLALTGEGTFAAGKEAVEDALSQMGIQKGSYSYADASGLSRLNLVSADILVRILGYMYRHPLFPFFYDALPIAGIDGTLEDRMKGTKAENNLRAKTGTIANVSSISGYLKAANGEMLAFSIIANGYLMDKGVAENLQNRSLLRLASFSRK